MIPRHGTVEWECLLRKQRLVYDCLILDEVSPDFQSVESLEKNCAVRVFLMHRFAHIEYYCDLFDLV